MDSATSLATPAASVRELTLAMSTALCYGIALGIFPALLSLNLENNGFDPSWSGLLGAVPALAGIAILPFSPWIVARIGARPAYFAGAVLSISTAALFPVLPGLAAWFVLRFLMGVGLAIQFMVGESWVNNLADGPKRGRIIGIYVIVLSVGLFVGPAIMAVVGTTGHAPFLVTAGLLLLACLPILLAHNMLPPTAGDSGMMSMVGALLRKPSAMITGLFDGFIFQTMLVLLPIYAIGLGASEDQAIRFMMIYMLGGIPLQLVIGYVLDRIGAEAVLTVCCALIALGLPAFAWLFAEPIVSWPILFVVGVASGAVYTAGVAAISGSFSAAEMPSGTAVFNIAWLVGGVAGPSAAGYAATLWDPHGFAGSIVISCVVLGLVNAVALRRRTPGSSGSARP